MKRTWSKWSTSDGRRMAAAATTTQSQLFGHCKYKNTKANANEIQMQIQIKMQILIQLIVKTNTKWSTCDDAEWHQQQWLNFELSTNNYKKIQIQIQVQMQI